MRGTIRVTAWMLLFGALGAAAASWFTPDPDVVLDEDDAIETALAALDAAGHTATVTKPVIRSGHVPDRGDPIEVFVVFADVAGDQVEVRVLTDAGQLAYVDDRIGPDGTGRLLTDEEFATMDRYDHRFGRDEWVARNVAATVAGLLVALSCFVIARRVDALWRQPS